jgi:cytochrome c peroxidase
MKKIYFIGGLLGLLLWAGCDPNTNPEPEAGDLLQYTYSPQGYVIKKPDHFPQVPIPADNPQTYAGVQLGRHLFYDPILSADSTMSCASCHLAQNNFTDGKAVSTGIDGIMGKRSSMSLLNVAYIQPVIASNDTFALFWDGRSKSLEDQALRPVEDQIELHNTWPNLVEKLKKHPEYPKMFREAFGITDRSEITKELAAKAMAQFERIMISSGQSIFDRYLAGEITLLQDEALDGKIMFFDEGGVGLPDAECFHCHGVGTLTGKGFFENGLDPFNALTDIGMEHVSGNPDDRGKFRVPTIRNIEMSAPYMHDGRFQTLEDVVDHYLFHSLLDTPYPNPNMALIVNKRAQYTQYHKTALVAFLKTLTDTEFVNNPDLKSPY